MSNDATATQPLPDASPPTSRWGDVVFEFSSYEHWVAYARLWFQAAGIRGDDPNVTCIDALGRTCRKGIDFKYAENDNAYPVKVYSTTHKPLRATEPALSACTERFDHELKIDPERIGEILRGDKTHEIRVFDRDFQVGHVLRLREYDRRSKSYTLKHAFVRVTNITAPGTYGLPHDVGVMSISLLT